MDFNTWLQQSWIILVAVVGGITLIWNFINKTLKEIAGSISKPIKDIELKIDKIDTKIEEAEARDRVVGRALLTMQRASILKLSEDYLKKGFSTLEEKEAISEQFASYSELGGNSFVSGMVSKVINLPLEKKSNKTTKTVEEEKE